MALWLNHQLTIREIVRMASDELDSRQLAIIARLSPTERLGLMFQMCDFMRNLAENVEQQEYPQLSHEEIAARISQRIFSAHG